MAPERKEVTCDICGRLHLDFSRNHYCEHCKKFSHVCPSCVEKRAKCRFCGIILRRKREPAKVLRR